MVERRVDPETQRILGEVHETVARSRTNATLRSLGLDDVNEPIKLGPDITEEEPDYMCNNPKCRDFGKNYHNVLDGKPFCFSCSHPIDGEKHNRAYWRAFKKKRT